MLLRLLKLRIAIIKYFRRHPNNSRRLGTQDWTVANEVYTLLEPVSDVTVSIQGSRNAHLSQATFTIKELVDVLDMNIQ